MARHERHAPSLRACAREVDKRNWKPEVNTPIHPWVRIERNSSHGRGKREPKRENRPWCAGIANPYIFTGRRFDDETGLYCYRNRYYSAELGRFVSRDPLRGMLVQPQTLQRHLYVTNNPVNLVDPTGYAAPGGASDLDIAARKVT